MNEGLTHCPRCGSPLDHVVEMALAVGPGEPSAARFRTCRPCYGEAERELEAYRSAFEMLLSTGLSRANANLSIIVAIERDRRSKPPLPPLPFERVP